ncbi:MAG: A/G-specific adenine glycosylase [Rhodanobacter sp.]|nr:MAG: A/G-specific adenine glycosylase [Rhodanobacter sp.]TAM08880.1 MAG: A/G-specific adenine glycosylase [Rhodanobacter sp.]TAM36922.1 MAG: A/G-specific adenine glycosylase [Rhodanobacter sp.]
MNRFADVLLAWFDRHGRHDLPWQHPRDAYRVWVSEIMLQQTQVATVTGYFQRFIAALPNLPALAAASEDEVFALWSGLGYYRRARFLHQSAQLCVERHSGRLPHDFAALAALPGIGRSTAGAILAQACGQRVPILDGNVKRVLARYHGIHGYPGERAVELALWQHADEHTPAARVADYTQAIMDLGATVCTRTKPDCATCPLAPHCVALRDGLVDALPTRKPGKALPTRETLMLVLRDHGGRVLLQRRGPQGVWAGLWSLPEAADAKAAAHAAAGLARVADALALPAFTHVFTHYRLHVTPWLYAHAMPTATVADAPDLRWCDAEAIAALGLPTPVRRLLLHINDIV